MSSNAEAAAIDAPAGRIEAQARAGELLRDMAERGDRGLAHGDCGSESHRATRSLADPAVTKSESSRWQQVALVPAEVHAEYIEETTAAGDEVSRSRLPEGR